MKREFITGLLPDIPKEALDAIMAENGKDIEAQKVLIAAETQKLTAANNTIGQLRDAAAKFEGVDLDDLKGKLKSLQEKYDQDIAALRLESALDSALIGSRAKNTKAVRALLNLDEIKLDGEKLLGLDSQLEAVKKEASYLFEDGDNAKGEAHSADGPQNGTGIRLSSGSRHGDGGMPDYDSMSDEEYYAAIEKRK